MSKRDWYIVGAVLIVVGSVLTGINHPQLGGLTFAVGFVLCVRNH